MNTTYRRRKSGEISVLTYAQLSLGMTDSDVVERFRQIVGCGSIYPRKRAAYETMYDWHVTRRADVERVATLFEPWLGARRQLKLTQVRSATSPVRRALPKRRLCNQGHWLTGRNAKPAGYTKKGVPKIQCRTCVNKWNRERWAQGVRRIDRRRLRPDKTPEEAGPTA